MRNRTFYISIFLVTLFSCKKDIANKEEVAESIPPKLVAFKEKVNNEILGYYAAIPSRYHESGQAYPLLVWVHGYGQIGNGSTDLPKVLYGGIPKVIVDSLFPASFRVNNKSYSFLILAPQFLSNPNIESLHSFIEFAKDNYRIDRSRIYISGLSGGGILTVDYASRHGSEIAAIVPIAGVPTSADLEAKCSRIAATKLPIWVFQNSGDDLFNVSNARSFVTTMNSLKPAKMVRYTEFQPFGEKGHDAWTTATDPNYREGNMNIYEWMLQHSR